MGGRRADVIRRVKGVRGTVRVDEVLRIRFDYADAIPWIRQSRSERGTGEHIGGVMHPEHDSGQQHRRYEHRRQG